MKIKAKKEIISVQNIELEFKDITLLSVEEYELYRKLIPPIHGWWWLRSSGNSSSSVAFVDYYDSVCYYGRPVESDRGAVRPALIFKSNLQVGDKVKALNYTWTVISDNMMICNSTVGHTYFRKDWNAPYANDYERSDIKQWLYDWLDSYEIGLYGN